jgi:hypothetical protein
VYENLILFTTPVSAGGRRIYSLVRVSELALLSGGWLVVEPVALLIEESGAWYFSPLEEGITDDILLTVMPG